MGCCQARPNVTNAITTLDGEKTKPKDEPRNSAASTKKNSKALEEGQDFQSVQAKELKSANIMAQNKASKTEGKHFEESAEKATKDEIGKELLINSHKKPEPSAVPTQFEDVKKSEKVEKVQAESKHFQEENGFTDGKINAKIEAVPKIISQEQKKPESVSDGGKSIKSQHNIQNKVDEQGSIPAVNEEIMSKKPNNSIVLPPIIDKKKTFDYKEETKGTSEVSKKITEHQQSSRNSINKNNLTETSMCISAIVHDYVGDVIEYALEANDDKSQLLEESVKFSEVHKSNNLSSYDDDDEKSYMKDQMEVNKSVESSSTIRNVAHNYVNDILADYMQDSDE